MTDLLALAVNDPHEVFWMQFSDCGEHIRRWSRTPFEGARMCRVELAERDAPIPYIHPPTDRGVD